MCQYQKPSRVWERGVKENAPNIKHGYWIFSKAKTYIGTQKVMPKLFYCLFVFHYNECTIRLWDVRMEDCQSCLILHIFKLCCQYQFTYSVVKQQISWVVSLWLSLIAVTSHFCLTMCSKRLLVGTDWSAIWRWLERHLMVLFLMRLYLAMFLYVSIHRNKE